MKTVRLNAIVFVSIIFVEVPIYPIQHAVVCQDFFTHFVCDLASEFVESLGIVSRCFVESFDTDDCGSGLFAVILWVRDEGSPHQVAHVECWQCASRCNVLVDP